MDIIEEKLNNISDLKYNNPSTAIEVIYDFNNNIIFE